VRLFTAIDIPEQVIETLDGLIARLRPAARIAWCRASNLHITTKFVGEWPEARLQELKDALASLPGREPLPIEIRGLGFFPNARSPAATQLPS
jgi:2'-5' RNA ligase